MDRIPDPGSLGRDELAARLKHLTERESAVSMERKKLHVQIDALRQALITLFRAEGQSIVISGAGEVDGEDPPINDSRTSTPQLAADGFAAAPGLGQGVPEARLEPTEEGLVPAGPGWFVLSALRARWFERTGQGYGLPLTGLDNHEAETLFPMLGMARRVMNPGEPSTTYHWETEQEDFLMLAGEAVLIIEGEVRTLNQWDFVHCPPGARHAFVGGGTGPSVLLCASSRQFQKNGPWGLYCLDPVAERHNASSPEDTQDGEIAYGRFPPGRITQYPGGLLPAS